MATANDHTEDRSTGELLRNLAQDMGNLVRQEVELAKAEVTQKGKKFGAGAGMFGGAGIAGFLALGALTACFILALNAVMPAALAAFVVAAVYGIVAAILFVTGRDRVKEAAPPVPEQTVESVKEDVEWLKNPTGSESASTRPASG